MRQEEMDGYRALIRENIEYDCFVRDHPYDAGQLDEMVELMVEAVCSTAGGGKRFSSGGGEVPAAEAGWGAYPVCVRLPEGKCHAGSQHKAVPASSAI